MVTDTISTDGGFRDLLSRLRSGDQAAAFELVRRYELTIRVAVRARLSDPALRRQLDSIDVCQSVLASFFLRAAAGQFELDNPRQLVALLTKMAEKKLAMQARRHFRQRRDARRTKNLGDGHGDVPSKEADPGQQAADRDLLQFAYALMGSEVREVADLRMAGEQWSEIAAKLGGTADGRRKQYQRALVHAARQLGFE